MAGGGDLAQLREEADLVVEFSQAAPELAVLVSHEALEPSARPSVERELADLLRDELRAMSRETHPPSRRSRSQADLDFDVILDGIELEPHVAERAADLLARRAAELLPDGGAAATSRGCVCASQIPGRRVPIADFLAGIGQAPPFVVALFPTDSQREALRWRVEEGAPYGIDSNATSIGLATEGVDWGKETTGWNMCRGGAVWRLYVEGRTSEEHAVHARASFGDGCRRSTHTPIFRKPGFLGWWIDVFHFPPDEFFAWSRGKRWTFTWMGDR